MDSTKEKKKPQCYGNEGTLDEVMRCLKEINIQVLLTKRDHRRNFYALHYALKEWRGYPLPYMRHATLYCDTRECQKFIDYFKLDVDFRTDEAIIITIMSNRSWGKSDEWYTLKRIDDKFECIKIGHRVRVKRQEEIDLNRDPDG
ncbi:hypothetical protein ACOME3_000802 [Neoechinorhynchus agilis]